MLTETTGRMPADLVAELRDELALDWVPLWKEMPWVGYPEFRELFERHDWEPKLPVHERGGMSARSRTGARLSFSFQNSTWGGVRILRHTAWHVRAEDASENGTVLERAAEAWPACLAAAESVLGVPTWTGPWDAEDFPEPPYPGYWPDRDFRLESRRPYAFAHWQPTDAAPGRPHVVLTQSVSFPTWTTTAPGGSEVSLELHAPREYLEPRS